MLKDDGQLAYENSEQHGHGICPWSELDADSQMEWATVERRVRADERRKVLAAVRAWFDGTDGVSFDEFCEDYQRGKKPC